ncbi:hypothetical protein LTR56_027613, partial [Elasticomyces elasticus]
MGQALNPAISFPQSRMILPRDPKVAITAIVITKSKVPPETTFTELTIDFFLY